MKMIRLVLTVAISSLALIACGSPISVIGGSGSGSNLEHPLLDSDCTASGFIVGNSASKLDVTGFVHIDCTNVPQVLDLTLRLQWASTYKPRGQARTWVNIGPAVYAGTHFPGTAVPDTIGETFIIGPVGCTEGRWRAEVDANGVTSGGDPRHDVVHGPIPAHRIKNCHKSGSTPGGGGSP